MSETKLIAKCIFSAEWNQGCCGTFIEAIDNQFIFRLSSKSHEEKIHDISLKLSLPRHGMLSKSILTTDFEQPLIISIPVKKGDLAYGVNQSADFYLTYKIHEETYWFYQEIHFDVLPNTVSASRMVENISIQMGDMNIPADNATKLQNSISHLNTFSERAEQAKDILEEIQENATFFEEIHLLECQEPDFFKATSTVQESNTIPKSSIDCLTLTFSNNSRLHIYSGNVTLGRNSQAEITTRNFSVDSESKEELERKNLRIGSFHCRLGIKSSHVWLKDGYISNTWQPSTNHTSLNGSNISGRIQFPNNNNGIELILAPSAKEDEQFALNCHIFQCSAFLSSIPRALKENIYAEKISACHLTRTDTINESYLLLRKWFQLNKLNENIAPKWFIIRHHNAFALSDNNSIYWLNNNCDLPTGCEIASVNTRISQIGL